VGWWRKEKELPLSPFSVFLPTLPVYSLSCIGIFLPFFKHLFVSGGGVSPPEDSEASRRPSKDESLSSSNSDSQQSGDEYNVYYYDPKALLSHSNGGSINNIGGGASGSGNAVGNTGGSCGGSEKKSASKRDEQNPLSPSTVFANLRKTEDLWDVLFARAEGLHAHGHGKEACTLGVRLAKELLANPPDLMVELPPLPAKGKRKKVCENLELYLIH